MTPTTLFVYGTLLSGERSHHLLKDATLKDDRYVLRGARLYRPQHAQFPALVPSPDLDDTVVGELYEIPSPLWAALDRLERYVHNDPNWSLYLRRDLGGFYTYVWNRSVIDMTHIPSGDWRRWEARTGVAA